MKEQRSKVKAKVEAAPPAQGSDRLKSLVDMLAESMERHHLSEVFFQSEAGMQIRLSRGATQVVAAPVQAVVAAAPAAPAPVAAAAPSGGKAETSDGNVSYITSPFVGTFYRSPGPDAAPFVDVGTRVRKGQVLCIVEAMKLMNEIESEIEGTVLQCLVENGQPVEYGEPLYKIKQG
jgi:acetyl-CoA carboxylase biotin carboxyl carrier protein